VGRKWNFHGCPLLRPRFYFPKGRPGSGNATLHVPFIFSRSKFRWRRRRRRALLVCAPLTRRNSVSPFPVKGLCKSFFLPRQIGFSRITLSRLQPRLLPRSARRSAAGRGGSLIIANRLKFPPPDLYSAVVNHTRAGAHAGSHGHRLMNNEILSRSCLPANICNAKLITYLETLLAWYSWSYTRQSVIILKCPIVTQRFSMISRISVLACTRTTRTCRM